MSGMLLDPMAKARRVVESHVEQIRELAPGDAPGFVHPEEDPPEACALLLQALALADIAESLRARAPPARRRLPPATPFDEIVENVERIRDACEAVGIIDPLKCTFSAHEVDGRTVLVVREVVDNPVDKSDDLTGDDGGG